MLTYDQINPKSDGKIKAAPGPHEPHSAENSDQAPSHDDLAKDAREQADAAKKDAEADAKKDEKPATGGRSKAAAKDAADK